MSTEHSNEPHPSLCVGEVVQLKSIGPPMTVSKIQELDVTCQWFIGDKLVTSEFDARSLQPYIDPPTAAEACEAEARERFGDLFDKV